MTDGKPSIRQAGDTALTIDLAGDLEPQEPGRTRSDEIQSSQQQSRQFLSSLGQSRRVLALEAAITALNEPGIVETVPALASLTVHYDPTETTAARLIDRLTGTISTAATGVERTVDPEPGFGAGNGTGTGITDVEDAAAFPPPRTWLIPACYEEPFAPDVAFVAGACGLSPWQVTALHACVSHRVLMIGFLPGFPYLGELPPPLQLPRRASPRSRVPAGSIAIASTMSVIYPHESPGGWHIIGRTPIRLFDQSRREPSLLAPGDEIRFDPVSVSEFERLSAKVDYGWTIEPIRCAI